MRAAALLVFLPAAALAAATTDYGGTAHITDLSTGAVSTADIVMARTVDPDKSQIAEIACEKEGGQPARSSPVFITVKDNTLTVSDGATPPMLSGTGTLAGPAWAWTTLTFSMDYGAGKGRVHIDDTNVLANGKLTAQKRISVMGHPIQTWEAELSPIAPEAYAKTLAAWGCR